MSQLFESLFQSTLPTTPAPPAIKLRVVAFEAEIVAVLDQPAQPGQSAATAFAHKEDVLRALFAALELADARELHRRLSNPCEDDGIARRVARMNADRQARLIAFLADARRRAALAAVRAR